MNEVEKAGNAAACSHCVLLRFIVEVAECKVALTQPGSLHSTFVILGLQRKYFEAKYSCPIIGFSFSCTTSGFGSKRFLRP